MTIQLSKAVLAAKGPGEDRVAMVELADGSALLVVADGAGGMGGGALAAERAVEAVTQAALAMRTVSSDAKTVREENLGEAAAKLVALPRLRSGALPDDVAVVLGRSGR